MEQGSEPLFFDGDSHTPLLPVHPQCPEATHQNPPAFLEPSAPQTLYKVLLLGNVHNYLGAPPVPLWGEIQPREGHKHFTPTPCCKLDAVPACNSPVLPWDAPERGAGPKACSSSSPAANGFCKTHALRGSRAVGCLSCASPGNRTGHPPLLQALSGMLSGNSAFCKPCG